MLKLTGVFTAIITPFLPNGKVDWKTLARLIERQILAGVAGIVPVGTTGESPTLNHREHNMVIRRVVEIVNGRCLVIAGTGGNDTAEALKLTAFAKNAGADASLQVTPYYSKPSPEGLYRHFAKTADLGLPIVLYNVPGRAGVPIPIDVIVRLSNHPMVVGIKEAGGDVDRVSQILSDCKIIVLSGDDPLTLPMMSVGAKGVISVLSNVLPADVVRLVQLALEGKWEDARQEHYRLYKLFKAMFFESNPIPVKATMAMMGLIQEEYRLPLCPITTANREKLTTTLQTFGLLA